MDVHSDLRFLADRFKERHDQLMIDWRRAVKGDPNLSQGDSLPRAELYDHIPALLAAFEKRLRQAEPITATAQVPAAAHGLQRWQQGYDLREVTRELGQLNRCVILDLDKLAKAHNNICADAMAQSREMWTELCSGAIEESVAQYYALQQQEAAGHVEDLEHALASVRELERERADLWREAAHDLRGNLGVVAHVAVGLTRHGKQDDSRENFVRILSRNVTSLHHLLDDVTSLARLQAGREKREVEAIDVATLLSSLCDGIRHLAEERDLYLRCAGAEEFGVEGDPVKVRRIAQNVILNAVKYTRRGGITVSWGDSTPDDPKRWCLTIEDTGPGFHGQSGQRLATALDPEHKVPPSLESETRRPNAGESLIDPSERTGARERSGDDAGEGIGLSIVKRLSEMLDATLEVASVKDRGTTFRFLFPRHYTK